VKVLRLLNDVILVRLEPRKEKTPGGIVKTSIDPVWIGEALMVGPGRQFKDKYVPMDVKVGDRVAFLAAATDSHRPGLALQDHLDEDQRLIRQSDVLFVVEGEVEISKCGSYIS
jgi:co-chaperonin GroES (HSP10)